MSKKLILSKKGESAVCGFHPWIFKGDISGIEGSPAAGDCVEVWGVGQNRWLAWAFYEGDMNLCAKIISWNHDETFSQEWLSRKLTTCWQLREQLGLTLNDAFRVVHSESDHLPGLIVDWFSGLCSVQITSSGMWERRDLIINELKTLLQPQALVLKTETKDSQNASLPLYQELVLGHMPEEGWPYLQNNLTWKTNPLTLQKTGAYLDQRVNHQKVAQLSQNKNVWDLYCNTGGFSIASATCGAQHVLGIDRSEKTIALAHDMKQNLQLNNVDFKQSEIKTFFEEAHTLEKPDLIVLDPPKLVMSNKTKDAGLRHYFRINELALSHLTKNGLLVSFSCSGRVSVQEWGTLITSVLRRNKRQGKIIEALSAAPDHPWNPHLPESQYLKGLIVQINA